MEQNNQKHMYIRSLTTDDLEQYNNLLRYAFQVTEQDLIETGYHNEEIKQSKFPVLERADVLGCFDKNSLVSQVAVYPLKMNIYDIVYSVGFVTSVCTYPEYMGNGIMKKLMYKSLVNMRKQNRSFAMLYPYSIPLYRHLGWEIISNKISYTVKDRQIPAKTNTSGFVRRVDWNNLDFMNLHTQFAQETHGCIFRNKLAWEEYWRWAEDDTVVAIYYNEKSYPQGYMVYLIKDDIMHIKEMIYLNHEAQLGLWEYIHAHNSMIDEVRGNNYFNEPIAFEMDDSAIKETIRPYIMGRIVDVEKFFEQYPCNPTEKNIYITFNITDSLLKWNNKCFNISFQSGHCSITKQSTDYTLDMSIATLTTLLLGYKTAAQLYRMDRIKGTSKAISILDEVIFHKTPYISDYI